MLVTFYTRPQCPLCEEALQMLTLVQEDYPLTWTTVSIEENDEAHEKYMLMIPVIEKDGQPVLYGSITYIDIMELFD